MKCELCVDKELVISEMPTLHYESDYATVTSSSLMVRLMNLHLVDTSSASWEQIIEFRRDETAKMEFIKMRDFLFSSCSELSQDELHDKFLAVIDNYKNVGTSYGFKMKKAAVDVLLTLRS